MKLEIGSENRISSIGKKYSLNTPSSPQSSAYKIRNFRFKRAILGLILSSLLITSIPRPARADTPLGALAIAFAVGVASGLVANAIYDAVTEDTTTTTTTTTTDSEGNTTTTTTTTTEKSTGTPTAPETPPYINISGTPVRDLTGENTLGQRIGRIQDNADVLLSNQNIKLVGYKVDRTIRQVLQRKSAFPQQGTRVPLHLNLEEFLISTRDIAGTDGWSKVTVKVSANGRVLYTFTAKVEMGRMPIFSDQAANDAVITNSNDILSIKNFHKTVEFDAERGRATDEISINILTEGVGRRL